MRRPGPCTRTALVGVAILVTLQADFSLPQAAKNTTASGTLTSTLDTRVEAMGVDGGLFGGPTSQTMLSSAADQWARQWSVAGPADTPRTPATPPTAPELRTGPSGIPAQVGAPRQAASAVLGAASRPGRVDDALWSAYRHAAATAPPQCRLPVELLAAIGEVESGSLRGRTLDAANRPIPAVLGPVLDGNGHAAIRDTDLGRWDGDATWDRAVGPMQLIPGTWQRWGRDGDGDGIADPQDLDDATVAAAAYLCAAGGDLSQDDQLEAAILAYNHSRAYFDTVLALMPTLRDASGSAAIGPVPTTTVTVTVAPRPLPRATVTQKVTVTAAPPPAVTVTLTQVVTATVTQTQTQTATVTPAPTETTATTNTTNTTSATTTGLTGTPIPPTSP